jgi:predicted CoA-binding protein
VSEQSTSAATMNGSVPARASETTNQPFNISQYQDSRVIQRLLHTARTIAIVGLSADPLRPSNFVGFYLQRHGYHIIPVNPREKEILDAKCYASLSDIPFPVDVVDVFRRPDAVPAIAEEAVKIGAKALWLQFGVISPEGARIAKLGGLDVVMDKCMKVEHARYMGKMHWYGLNTGVISSKRE